MLENPAEEKISRVINQSQNDKTQPEIKPLQVYKTLPFIFKITGITIIYLLIFIAGSIIGLKTEIDKNNKEHPTKITVFGEAITKKPADKAHLTIDIVDYDTDYNKTWAQNEKRATEFITLLTKLGIPKTDIIKNSQASVPNGANGIYLPKLIGQFYHAHSFIDITIDDINKYDQILSLTSNLGEHLNGIKIDYELKTPDLPLNQTKERAFENAREQAADIANINNLKVVSGSEKASNSAVLKKQKPITPLSWNSNFIIKDAEMLSFFLQP